MIIPRKHSNLIIPLAYFEPTWDNATKGTVPKQTAPAVDVGKLPLPAQPLRGPDHKAPQPPEVCGTQRPLRHCSGDTGCVPLRPAEKWWVIHPSAVGTVISRKTIRHDFSFGHSNVSMPGSKRDYLWPGSNRTAVKFTAPTVWGCLAIVSWKTIFIPLPI